MTREEIESIAKVAGRVGAHETLLALGIDASKPIDTQRDFAHLRWWREIAESVTRTAVIAFFVSAGGVVGGLIWAGFKLAVK